MNFDLTEEQNILKKSAHDFLAKNCPKELVRELKESEEGYSPELWQKMTQQGWMGMMFPEEYGGSEFSFLDLVLLLEEMGYNICPGPFFSTVVLGGLPILLAGDEAQKREFLPGIASGEIFLTLALTEANCRHHDTLPQVNAVPDNDGYVINSTKLFVLDAHLARHFLCVTRTGEASDPEEGITIFLVDAQAPGITRTRLKTLENDKQFEVVFDGVRVPKENILGGLDQGGPVLSDALRKAALARSAEMIGGAQAVMDMAMVYAKERVQFGRPIGSFQSVQNHFADMWIHTHGARVLLYQAAWKVGQGMTAEREIAVVKALAGRACRRITILGHQIFAAISFTMEHDMHLYHRQAMGGDLAFGNSDFQRKKVARELGL